ncbi:Flagellar motor switch protein FliG [Defluviimonas aquaemixtae]|uniref:Flagellar motor switch protein FliG n=1 Tax=Albidovulum aquaemixtae TaxID=1542388 RepID=A0A2R8B4Q6_9RHOB|nr:FliG C-terminal domain-containing protein [Defluviimonas aquaemixtae]SPH17591.1 Flagellar motor switch protein FliG [Defluviimonas aquaemixtae]
MTALAPLNRRGDPSSSSSLAARPVAAPGVADLSGRQKAAIIVRLLLSEGSTLPLQALPDHMQAALTEQIGSMRSVDRFTLRAVVEEFLTLLESVGLSFPGGIDGALRMLDGHISPTAASRLRRLAGASAKADPWDRIAALDPEKLLPVLTEESVEVCAVMLSKLAVPRAAELLGKLPGDRARRIAYAVSRTGNIDPETVRQIGLSLISQLEAQPVRAFDSDPFERVGAILNVVAAPTRDDVLLGLSETDEAFARQVRKAIFTFADIPDRIVGRDISKVIRGVDQATLVTALAGASGEAEAKAAEFILENLSGRMAASLREEVSERGTVKEKDADAAMNAIVTSLRALEASGELTLIAAGEED